MLDIASTAVATAASWDAKGFDSDADGLDEDQEGGLTATAIAACSRVIRGGIPVVRA